MATLRSKQEQFEGYLADLFNKYDISIIGTRLVSEKNDIDLDLSLKKSKHEISQLTSAEIFYLKMMYADKACLEKGKEFVDEVRKNPKTGRKVVVAEMDSKDLPDGMYWMYEVPAEDEEKNENN